MQFTRRNSRTSAPRIALGVVLSACVLAGGCVSNAAPPTSGTRAAWGLDALPAGCPAPDSTQVASAIRSVFECELRRLGVPPSAYADDLDIAVAIAWRESRHIVDIVIYGGRYVNTRRPADGRYYTAAGLFQIVRRTADANVPGGYARTREGVPNIVGAARIWHWYWSRHLDPWTAWGGTPANPAALLALR